MIQTNAQQPGDPTVVIDALIDGLRISKKDLNEKCKLALLSLGGRAAFRVQVVAYDPVTQSAHRRRLEDVLKVITGRERIAAGAVTHLMEALLYALRVEDKQLNERAIAAFGALPVRLIDILISEAVLHQWKAASYCARLLKAADVVDGIPDVTQRIDLIDMMSSTDETVRKSASDLVWKLRLREQN